MPTIKEILQQIVEAETVDERMEIVEANEDMLMGSGADVEQMTADIERLTGELADAVALAESLKEKYRKKFFSNDNPAPANNDTDEDETPAETKSLDETLSDMEEEARKEKEEDKE